MGDDDEQMNGVRGYLRELRVRQEVSLPALGKVMGLAPNTLIAWEQGHTKELKAGPLLRAVRHLGGSGEDLLLLADEDTPESAGRALARKRLGLPDMDGEFPPDEATTTFDWDRFTREARRRVDHALEAENRALAQSLLDTLRRLIQQSAQQAPRSPSERG
jgi:transcriptional regulator with XRE-family HTH domain